jgi:hypothetical protein
MVNIRTYESADYPIALEWWQRHGWDGVPEKVLPPLGWIAENEDRDICAIWAYLTAGKGIAWMEWLVSNPEASPLEVRRGIKALVDTAKMTLHALDYNIVLTSCIQPSLVRVLQAEGFTVTDQGVTHLIQEIKVPA